MAKYSKTDRPSSQTQAEAMRIARGTQKPGQTKEQTRLIAQGIQKGIDQYKKQYKAKARELDKRLRKSATQPKDKDQPRIQTAEIIKYKQSPLPWVLLLISWVAFAAYLVLV